MLPEDQIRLITCLVLSFFCSYGLGKVKNHKLFILGSFLLTVAFQVYVFQWQVLILWVQQQIVYFLCRFGKRSKIGKIVLYETFAYLMLVQLRRMWVTYAKNDVDITAVLMMQAFLYIGFAYNYQDGLDPDNSNPRKIQHLPQYYKFIGYVFFLPASLVGPVFEFKDYENYLVRSGHYSTLESTIPGILRELKTFIITLGIYLALLPFSVDFMLLEEFSNDYNALQKVLYMSVAIFAFRFKYYTAWSLGMLGMNATGITYNEPNKENQWGRIEVSDIWNFETSPSMKVKADSWNQSVQLALKRYIYDKSYISKDSDSQRQVRSKKRKAQEKTLFVSAIWHGLYPGYFVSFFHWALVLQISQQIFRIRRMAPRFDAFCQKYSILETIFFNFFIGYFGVFFVFMTMDKILAFAASMYYVPPVFIYAANILIVRMRVFSKGQSSRSELPQRGRDALSAKKADGKQL